MYSVHSWGMTAQERTLSAPDRVNKLVRIGTYAKADNKRRMLLKNWAELVQKDLLTETFVYSRLLWPLHEDTIEQGDLIDAMIQFFREKEPPVSADLFVRQCNACTNHDSTGRLECLAQSTLILYGKDDILTPRSFTAK